MCAKQKIPFQREIAAVTQFLVWQVVAAGFASMLVYFLWSKSAALSACLGGLTAIVPNIVLALYLFKRNNVYVGELLKIVLVAGLFVFVLRFFDVQLLPFLVGLCSVYAVYFAAQLMMS